MICPTKLIHVWGTIPPKDFLVLPKSSNVLGKGVESQSTKRQQKWPLPHHSHPCPARVQAAWTAPWYGRRIPWVFMNSLSSLWPRPLPTPTAFSFCWCKVTTSLVVAFSNLLHCIPPPPPITMASCVRSWCDSSRASHEVICSLIHSIWWLLSRPLFFLTIPNVLVTPLLLRKKLKKMKENVNLILHVRILYMCIGYHCCIWSSYPPEHGSSESLYCSHLSHKLCEHTLFGGY